MFVAEE
jgi:serine/threonine-protein phosphatase 2B catalytic subunit